MKRKHSKEEIKNLTDFYNYFSNRFNHDDDRWSYIQRLFDEYVGGDRTIFVDKIHRPSVKDAIRAIMEKSKVKLSTSPKDYLRFAKEMDAIDKKHHFKD